MSKPTFGVIHSWTGKGQQQVVAIRTDDNLLVTVEPNGCRRPSFRENGTLAGVGVTSLAVKPDEVQRVVLGRIRPRRGQPGILHSDRWAPISPSFVPPPVLRKRSAVGIGAEALAFEPAPSDLDSVRHYGDGVRARTIATQYRHRYAQFGAGLISA